MATWQFDLHLLPEETLRLRYGGVPIAISYSDIEAGEWWKGIALPADLAEQLSRLLPRGRSWSNSIQTWGQEDGNRIDLVWEDDRLADVFVRIDVRHLTYDFLHKVLHLARANHWALWTPSTRVLKPSLEQLLRAIQGSDSFRFVEDPRGFFDALERNSEGGPDR